MPRLNVVEADQATGNVKEIYDGYEEKLGRVINIFKGLGNSEAALTAYKAMSGALAAGDLSTEDREAIYLAVSEKNKCSYCVSAHTMIAKGAGMNEDQILEFRLGRSSDNKLNTLIEFTLKVIETNGVVADADIQGVRDAGYTDGQIAEVVAYISLATYTNLFNHVFDTELDFPQAASLG
ncbi:MAG: carboxymuconolactone decarboxylase family protein [Pirellulaceae bacterium]|nr:carboxymuconolactone decarboxylase family protein [Pirellulaceae bacterium]